MNKKPKKKSNMETNWDRFKRWYSGDVKVEEDGRFVLGDERFEKLKEYAIKEQMPKILFGVTAVGVAGFAGGVFYSRPKK